MMYVKFVDSCLTGEALCKLVTDQILAVFQATLSHFGQDNPSIWNLLKQITNVKAKTLKG